MAERRGLEGVVADGLVTCINADSSEQVRLNAGDSMLVDTCLSLLAVNWVGMCWQLVIGLISTVLCANLMCCDKK